MIIIWRWCGFSLPMRDGNTAPKEEPKEKEVGFSLPMRDGNSERRFRQTY